MPTFHVLRVFTNSDGGSGNPLGVFPDGADVPEGNRKSIVRELGFSETVFVDDPIIGSLRIFTPRVELSFARHPLVGTAWLLKAHGHRVVQPCPLAGSVNVWEEGGRVWVRGRTEWAPTWAHIEATSVDEVERANQAPPGHDHVQLWAFRNEAEGIVRARVFAPRVGVAEDEACGSASMVLAAKLGRALTIQQRHGSEILVRPEPDGTVELGGRVRLCETRDVTLGHKLAVDGRENSVTQELWV